MEFELGKIPSQQWGSEFQFNLDNLAITTQDYEDV